MDFIKNQAKKIFISLLLSILCRVGLPQSAPINTAEDTTALSVKNRLLVDAGGHKLHLNIQGKGSPTVLFENGSGDFSFIWSLVQPGVSKFTQTISYDRAGYAWSEPGPEPRTSEQICWELHTALVNAGMKPPYILVGQSFGGFLVRAFYRYYPTEVAGMVLVDAVQENQRIFMGGDEPHRVREFAKGRIAPALRTHYSANNDSIKESSSFTSEIDPLFDKFPDSIKTMQRRAQSQSQFIQAVQGEMDWSPEDVENLYKHTGERGYLLGNIPLVVMTRERGGFDGRPDSSALEKERMEAQRQLSQLSKNSKLIIVKNAGHNIHVDDPRAVISAIKEVFTAVVKHARLK